MQTTWLGGARNRWLSTEKPLMAICDESGESRSLPNNQICKCIVCTQCTTLALESWWPHDPRTTALNHLLKTVEHLSGYYCDGFQANCSWHIDLRKQPCARNAQGAAAHARFKRLLLNVLSDMRALELVCVLDCTFSLLTQALSTSHTNLHSLIPVLPRRWRMGKGGIRRKNLWQIRAQQLSLKRTPCQLTSIQSVRFSFSRVFCMCAGQFGISILPVAV